MNKYAVKFIVFIRFKVYIGSVNLFPCFRIFLTFSENRIICKTVP